MDKKPEWVPDWVWNEYIHVMKDDYWPTEGASPDEREILTRLISSKPCGVVWSALERRNAARMQSQSEMLSMLSEEICAGLNGFEGSNRTTRAQRIKVCRDIVKQTAKLRDLFRELSRRDADKLRDVAWSLLPTEFLCAAEAVALEQHDHGLNSFFVKKLPDKEREANLNGFVRARINPWDALDAIDAGARAWGDSVPIVPRPNADSADRVFFVRVVTNFFSHVYRTPLRECTLAITSVFFDCENLDAAAIAQLAPCSETIEKDAG